MNEGTMKEVNSKESKSGRLRTLARGKNSQMKLQCLQKVRIYAFWVVGLSNQLFIKGS